MQQDNRILFYFVHTFFPLLRGQALQKKNWHMKHPIVLYTKLNSFIHLICYIDGQSWLQVEDAHHFLCFLAERMNHNAGIMNHLMT